MTLARRRQTAAAIAAGVLALLAAQGAIAQAADVDVVVAGAPAGEPVTLANPANGYTATLPTNAEGHARFSAVPAGDGYEVRVGGQARVGGIRLRANERRSVNLEAPVTLTVTTQRIPGVVNATDAEVSAGLDARQLAQLPLEARDVARALARLPNVVPSTGFFPEAPIVSINGANGLYTQYLLDGLDNNENFLGGPKFPAPAGFVQDLTVLSAAYPVEYGRTANGVVNVTTRAGTSEWHGEAFWLGRPGAPPDSSSSYPQRDLTGNGVKDGFRRNQGGLAAGGPLGSWGTRLYADVEYARDDKDNRLSSPELGVDTTVPGHNTQLLASARLDQPLADAWRLSLRFNHGDVRVERQGGGLDGGVTFPSAGSTEDRLATLAAATLVYDGLAFTSETSAGYSRFRWNYGRALAPAGPQVTARGPDGFDVAVLGSPGFVFDDLEDTVQLREQFTLPLGSHALRAGFDLQRSNFSLAGGGNPAGNYTVSLTQPQLDAVRALDRGAALVPEDLPADAVVTNYAVELLPATFGRGQGLVGLWLQDQVTLTPELTATAGLRWDYDSLSQGGAGSGDGNNVAPRLALNWRVTPDVVLRGGAGLYYERLPYTVLSDALQQNTTSAAFRGQLQELVARGILPASTDLGRVTFDGNLVVNPACTTYLHCPTGETNAALGETTSSNERRILNPSGLDNPYAWQFTVGSQWQARDDTVLSADVIYSRGGNLVRLRDLNAPAPFTPNVASLTPENVALLRSLDNVTQGADLLTDRQRKARDLGLIRTAAEADATRPVQPVPGGARKIVVTETGGQSRYLALNLRLAKDVAGDFYGYALSYTLSSLRNNTDDLNFQASNANDFGAEWGPSVNDRRHVISALLYLHPLRAVTVTLGGLFQSGQPVNQIPDTSIYGTTDLNGDGASFSDAYLGNSDRAPGVGRNTGRLPWSKTVDAGLRWAPRLGPGSLELSADVFNVFDTTNLSGFANAATQSNQVQVYGQPFVQRNAGAPRQFQFGVRYLW